MVSPGERVMIPGRKVYFRGNQIKVDISMTRPDGEEVCSGILAGKGVPRAEFEKKREQQPVNRQGESDGGCEGMKRRVVITGMGVVAPNGHGLAAFEKALREGISGIRHIPELAKLNFACQVGGVPQDFEAVRNRYFDPEELLSLNDNIGYASVAAVDAWTDAGFTVPEAEDDCVDWETGVIAGSGIGGMDTIAQQLVPMVNEGNVRRMGSRIVEQVMNSGTSARIAGLLALGNQVTSNSSACSTGNEAMIEAVRRIRNGLATRMLAGGSEGAVSLHLGRLRRHARDLPEVQRPAGAGLPADERERLRIRSRVGRRPPHARGAGNGPGAGSADLRRDPWAGS